MPHSRATVGHEKAYMRLDQVQRLISRKGPRERVVGLKKGAAGSPTLLATLRGRYGVWRSPRRALARLTNVLRRRARYPSYDCYMIVRSLPNN
jgi:hypothetical protein